MYSRLLAVTVLPAALTFGAAPVAAATIHRPLMRINQEESSNWAGYAASSSNGTFDSVSSYWVQPQGYCGSRTTYSAFWVGLDGYSSPSVEQTGSEVDCDQGSPEYYAWYEMYPANPHYFSNAVYPGDQFYASVTFDGGGEYTLYISDETEGWSHTVNKTEAGLHRSSAEIIAEAPCCNAAGNPLQLTNFSSMTFTGAQANGYSIGSWGALGLYMASPTTGATEAVPSGLRRGGQNFTVTWYDFSRRH